MTTKTTTAVTGEQKRKTTIWGDEVKPRAAKQEPKLTPERKAELQRAATEAASKTIKERAARVSGKPKAAKPAKAPKPPFGLHIGRVKNGAYGFEHLAFTSAKDALAALTKLLAAETHGDGLRELNLSVRPEVK